MTPAANLSPTGVLIYPADADVQLPAIAESNRHAMRRAEADMWEGVPEWARFLHGIGLLLLASTAVYFVYHSL
jgi:hypothetical protein